MKKFLISFIMILLLLVPTINHAQAKRERPKPPFKTVVESFDGEFTNFRETKSWELKNGELQFSGGDTTQSYLNYLDDDYSDFTISVKAKWTGRDSWSNFGLYFRGMEDEFYVFSISKEQELNLSKHKGDKWEYINPHSRIIRR